MRISLIANKDLTYAGHNLTAGDYFEATPIEAAALTYQRKARFTRKRDRIKVEEVEAEYGLNSLTDTPDAEIPRPKRRYRRRDLQAEE